MIRNVVFDIGNVLLDWSFGNLYQPHFDTPEEMEHFLATVPIAGSNHFLDLGTPWDDVRAGLVEKFPDHERLIDLYWANWVEIFDGPIHESVDILMDIKRRGIPVYALTNFNAEKFQVALKEFPFLNLFDGRIVSAEVGVAKPDAAIYRLLLDQFNLDPAETVFIDDKIENVDAARKLGIHGIHFTSPRDLEQRLGLLGVLEMVDEDETDSDDDEIPHCGGGCTCHSR